MDSVSDEEVSSVVLNAPRKKQKRPLKSPLPIHGHYTTKDGKLVCNYCTHEYVQQKSNYGGAISNFKKHLKKFHPSIAARIMTEDCDSWAAPSEWDSTDTQTLLTQHFKCEEATIVKDSGDARIALSVIGGLCQLPTSFFSSMHKKWHVWKPFREAVGILPSPPTSETIRFYQEMIYKAGKLILQKFMCSEEAGSGGLSLSIDGWTGEHTEGKTHFIGVTVTWLYNFKRFSALLGLEELKELDALHIVQVVNGVMEKYGEQLWSRVTHIITDHEATIVSVVKKILYNIYAFQTQCVAHLIELGVNDAIKSEGTVENERAQIFEKSRKMVKKLRHSNYCHRCEKLKAVQIENKSVNERMVEARKFTEAYDGIVVNEGSPQPDDDTPQIAESDLKFNRLFIPPEDPINESDEEEEIVLASGWVPLREFDPKVVEAMNEITEEVIKDGTDEPNLPTDGNDSADPTSPPVVPLLYMLDCVTRWWSRYAMLARIYVLQYALKAALAIADEKNAEELTPFLLKSSDYKDIELILMALKPFAVIQKLLEGTDYSTSGLVLVQMEGALHQLRSVISSAKESNRSGTGFEFAEALLKSMTKRWGDRSRGSSGQIDRDAHLIDPRTLGLLFKQGEHTRNVGGILLPNIDSATNTLIKNIRAFNAARGRGANSDQSDVGSTVAAAKPPEVSHSPGFDYLRGLLHQEALNSTTSEDKVREQVQYWLSRKRIGEKSDIYACLEAEWDSLSHIRDFMMAILGANATSAGAERAFSTAGNVATPLRNRLKPESLAAACWIHDNVPVLQELTGSTSMVSMFPRPTRGSRKQWNKRLI